ncbi:MAG TPA: ATPase [Candidatus Altiarchaeales archaeon]|mgnify:CR=1 FL=1|nr:ATPase [Candidatus Altiarchaeales archaeon]
MVPPANLHCFGVFILILAASRSYTPLNPLYHSMVEYLGLMWWAVGLGLLIGGLIEYFIPREYISKMLSKKEGKTIFYAVGLGFLMSACSHGILAIAIQLYRKGASVPAVVAFLMAAPWANMTYTLLLFSLFGLKAFYIIFSAILIALTTGFTYQSLDSRGKVERNTNTLRVREDFSIRRDVKARIEKYKFERKDAGRALAGIMHGGWSLATMIVWWILIGIMAASIIGAYVPPHVFMTYLGPTILGLAVTLAAATIIEVCSEGSSPIAFEIFRQTGAFGNSFVFLMAGVATDYTEIGILWTNVGRRTALWLPVVAGPQIIVLGYLFNALL